MVNISSTLDVRITFNSVACHTPYSFNINELNSIQIKKDDQNYFDPLFL